MYVYKHTYKFIYILDNREIYCSFRTCSIISVLFTTEFHLFHNIIFFCSNDMFFINHALKFKYQSGCWKVTFDLWRTQLILQLFVISIVHFVVRIFITSAVSAKRPLFGKQQNGGYVQRLIFARARSLQTLFVPTDEAGLETKAFCWCCKGSARIAGSPWQHFRWRFWTMFPAVGVALGLLHPVTLKETKVSNFCEYCKYIFLTIPGIFVSPLLDSFS